MPENNSNSKQGDPSAQRTVTTWYLEMLSASEHQASPLAADFEVKEAHIKQFQVNRFLYSLVGAQWYWTEKLGWTDEDWKQYAESDNLRTWVAYTEGSIAGYFELQSHAGNEVELVYFGLAPAAVGNGKGFGRSLLSTAIDNAWQHDNTKRVWLHTCTDDHPHALNNYKSRGFKVYKEETEIVK